MRRAIAPGESVANVVRDGHGNGPGFVGAIRDTTDQERWRSEVELKAETLERGNIESERFVTIACMTSKRPSAQFRSS